MTVLKISTYIKTSITALPVGLAAILVIMSVSTFKTTFIVFLLINDTRNGLWVCLSLTFVVYCVVIISDFIPINNETNLVQLTKTMEDLLKASVISNIEIMPWLLSSLVDRLKHTVSQFHPLVPQGFYLPSPPLYCPQPSDTSQVCRQVTRLLCCRHKIYIHCNMNAFFSFDLFMVYIPECKQQLRTMK